MRVVLLSSGLRAATQLVRLLRQTDAQIFAGWRHEPGLFDTDILKALHSTALQVYELVSSSCM